MISSLFSFRHPSLLAAQQFISDDYSSDIFGSIILQPSKKKVKGVFPKCSTCKIKHGVTFHPARHILMSGALNEDPTGSSNQNDINHQAHLRRQSRPGNKDKNDGAKSFAVVAGQKSLCLQHRGANHISEKIKLETHRINIPTEIHISVRVTVISFAESLLTLQLMICL